MNEIEYAITNLEEFLEADIGQGDLHMCSAETALTALREKAEREKGCEYCEDGEDLSYGHDSMQRTGRIYLDGNLLTADLYSEPMAVVVRFCPVCGKRLEVEHEADFGIGRR